MLGEVGNGPFSTQTLSFHVQTDWRRGRKTLTDGREAKFFHHTPRFCPFNHTTGPFRHETSLKVGLLDLVEMKFFYKQISAENFYPSEHVSAESCLCQVT